MKIIKIRQNIDSSHRFAVAFPISGMGIFYPVQSYETREQFKIGYSGWLKNTSDTEGIVLCPVEFVGTDRNKECRILKEIILEQERVSQPKYLNLPGRGS